MASSRFRLHKSGVPFQTTLGVTDRSCITFCISESKLDSVAGPLESIYQYLKTEVTGLAKQELQRITPLVWSGSKCTVPVFFQHQYIAFLDVRRHTKQPHNQLQNKIQEMLISMDIPYHFQKRSILVLYASGILLETFRQASFHQNIIFPFGREEGCFQYNFAPNCLQDSWQIELETIGSTQYEAYQIEDDGTLMARDGSGFLNCPRTSPTILMRLMFVRPLSMSKVKVSKKLLLSSPIRTYASSKIIRVMTECFNTNNLMSTLMYRSQI